MTSRERMDAAMNLRVPDRVPVMCQLSLGHYFLHSGLDAFDVWYSTEGFAEALIRMQRRYGFDGILINLPGRDPKLHDYIRQIIRKQGEHHIVWKDGSYAVLPDADIPHVFQQDGTQYFATLDDVDPEKLFYIEPHDISGVNYPYSWGFDSGPATIGHSFFPSWHFDTIKEVVRRVGEQVSVHAEVFSPFSQLIELFGVGPTMLAIRRNPAKLKECLAALSAGTAELAHLQVNAGAHAILISSAFAGAGFLGRHHYQEFVLPYESRVITALKQKHDTPVYTHTCGDIGDRLDLMEETGTNGIDTLDPPPLGTVDIADAKRKTAGCLFLKGNLNPVDLMNGSQDDALTAARQRMEAAADQGGYILSTACSVAPATPPENVLALRKAVEAFGYYD